MSFCLLIGLNGPCKNTQNVRWTPTHFDHHGALDVVCYSSFFMTKAYRAILISLLGISIWTGYGYAQDVETGKPAVPDWALPGSATHKQVPPPRDFHRPSRTFETPVGIFEGESDVGSALVPGSNSYDAGAGQYTVNSAGYNVWYNRDEFRFLWKKMSGDVSLAADATFPNPEGYNDRKAMLLIRQSLDDDSKEAVVAEHGTGMIHLAQRPETNVMMVDEQFRFGGALAKVMAKRIGIEKRGDMVAIFVSLEGEPMHQFGPQIELHFAEPFYVGLGFCSHLPDQSDTAVFSRVVLKNSAGEVN